MLAINTRSPVPIYEQIHTSITRLVLAGVLAPQDRLPSVRQIAKDHGINPNTVSKAYSLLESQGIIYSVPGRGCFVADGADSNQQLQQEVLAKFKQIALECQATLIEQGVLIQLVSDIYGASPGGENT